MPSIPSPNHSKYQIPIMTKQLQISPKKTLRPSEHNFELKSTKKLLCFHKSKIKNETIDWLPFFPRTPIHLNPFTPTVKQSFFEILKPQTKTLQITTKKKNQKPQPNLQRTSLPNLKLFFFQNAYPLFQTESTKGFLHTNLKKKILSKTTSKKTFPKPVKVPLCVSLLFVLSNFLWFFVNSLNPLQTSPVLENEFSSQNSPSIFSTKNSPPFLQIGFLCNAFEGLWFTALFQIKGWEPRMMSCQWFQKKGFRWGQLRNVCAFCCEAEDSGMCVHECVQLSRVCAWVLMNFLDSKSVKKCDIFLGL